MYGYSCVALFAFVRHYPAYSQILISLEGSGEVLINGEWLTCGPGMVYLTPASVLHAYHACTNQPWKISWVSYDEAQSYVPIVTQTQPVLFPFETQELMLALDGLYYECLGAADETVMYQWAFLLHAYTQCTIRQISGDQRLAWLWKHVDARLAYAWNNHYNCTS